MSSRNFFIDVLRGVAILMMVLFHSLFDISYVWNKTWDLTKGFWNQYVNVTASIFLILAGVSLVIKSRRFEKDEKQFRYFLKSSFLRGLKILCFGLIISLVTYLADAQRAVWFGILHLIGTGTLFTMFFVRQKWCCLIMAVLLLYLQFPLEQVQTQDYRFLFMGIKPPSFTSFDYFPAIPWLAMILLGIPTGHAYLKHGNRIILPQWNIFKYLAFTGRHSLIIYLLHQPILLGLFFLIKNFI